MADQENKILLPAKLDIDVESLMFPVPLRPTAGKCLCIMVPDDDKIGEAFEVNGQMVQLVAPDEVKGKLQSRHQPDIGIVARFTPRKDDKGNYLYEIDKQIKVGMVVAIAPYTGVWFMHGDQGFDWIPPGRMIKILGSTDALSNHLLAEIELDMKTVAA